MPASPSIRASLRSTARSWSRKGLFTATEVERMHADFRALLEEEFAASEAYRPNRADWLDGKWSGIGHAEEGARRGVTGVDLERLKEIGRKLTTISEELHPAQDDRPHHGRAPQDDRGWRRHRLGDGGVARLWHACSSRAFAFGCRARTASAAPSRSGTRC